MQPLPLIGEPLAVHGAGEVMLGDVAGSLGEGDRQVAEIFGKSVGTVEHLLSALMACGMALFARIPVNGGYLSDVVVPSLLVVPLLLAAGAASAVVQFVQTGGFIASKKLVGMISVRDLVVFLTNLPRK